MSIQSIYDIVTQASILLGSVPIQSFSEDTREVEVFSNLWSQCLDALLSEGSWSFATKDFNLNQNTLAPVDPNYQYSFQLPADYLHARFAQDESGSRIHYVIQGGNLYANNPTVILKYIRQYQEVDLPLLPAWFVNLFIIDLAAKAAEPLVGIADVRDRMVQQYNVELKNARVRNAKDEPTANVLAPSRITQSRFRGVR